MRATEVNLDFVQSVLDGLSDPIFVKDREHRWIVFNQAFCELLGWPRERLLGRSDPEFFPPEQVEVFWSHDDRLFESGEANENEELLTDEEGVVHTIWTRKYPVRGPAREVVGLVGVITDITSLRARLDSVDALELKAAQQQAVIDAQQRLIDTMEVPVISVWEGILLVPLVGEVSSRRATLVLDHLLMAATRESTHLAFLDISGVPTIDAASAALITRAVRAARLIGTRVDLVGVSPANARLFIEQGIDLGQVVVHRNLREGLRTALSRLAARREGAD